MNDPQAQRRPWNIDPNTAQHLFLTKERQMILELRDNHVTQQTSEECVSFTGKVMLSP